MQFRIFRTIGRPKVKSLVDIRFAVHDKFCGKTNPRLLGQKMVAEMQALGFKVKIIIDQCEN